MYNINSIARLYVSQSTGDDDNSGLCMDDTKAFGGPVKNIQRALDIVREIREFGGSQAIAIEILDKEFFLEKPIVIDGGISSVTIEPFKRTDILCAVRLGDFSEDNYNGVRCVSWDISELIEKGLWFTDFYVNDKRAKMTRYPENGFLYPQEVEDNSKDLTASSKWFIVGDRDRDVVSKFKNFDDCIISYNHWWIDEHSPVESYENGKIVFKYPSRFTITPEIPVAKLEYYIENVAESFKNEGEWYIDRQDRKLYYIPLGGEEKIDAYLPITDKAFIVEGTRENRVESVVIRGFGIKYTRGEYKSMLKDNGEASWEVTDDESYARASDPQSVAYAHGSIEFRFAHNCSLSDCTINCSGVHAVTVYEGCDHIYVCSNNIENCGGGGIAVSGKNCTEKEYHTHSINIYDNVIAKCGRRYSASCGIIIRFAYDNKISHNTISDIYYTGISAGWVWDYQKSVCGGNIIEKNHIFDIGKYVLSDMGGIYLLGRQPGTVVRGNLIHNVKGRHYGGWALYTDQSSSDMLIENNVCYDVSSNVYHQHFGSSNVVRNNIFAMPGEELIKESKREPHCGIIFETNIFACGDKPLYSFVKHTNEYGTLASSNNIIFCSDKKNPILIRTEENKEFTFEEARKKGMEVGSVIADPEFFDIDACDFRLKDTSIAYKLGFKSIDMTDVGAKR